MQIYSKKLLASLAIALALTIPMGYADKEITPDACPPNSEPSTCLSLDPELRDKQLNKIYTVGIPILIEWDLAHKYTLKQYLTDPFVLEDWSLLNIFRIPTPGNPYRQPQADKHEPIPNNLREWILSLEIWMAELKYREILITLGENVLKDAQREKYATITVRGDDKLFSEGLLMRPLSYNENEFSNIDSQQEAAEAMLMNPELGIKTERLLRHEEIEAIQEFVIYHRNQADIFRTFIAKFRFAGFPHARQNPEFKNYFISAGKAAHSMINVEPLQVKERGDAEVVVFDWGFKQTSHHINYIGKVRPKKHSKPVSHGEQVAGILAAKEELAQLKGVAPGARVLNIPDLLPASLKKLNESSARVINISATFTIPKWCAPVFDRWQQNKKSISGQSHMDSTIDPFCKKLWDFVEIVQNKDMLIVQSAGNEGLQLEKNNWETGKYDRNLTFGIIGIQFDTVWNDDFFTPDAPDLTHIMDQIPQLKDRVILVGNLWKDGVTVAKDSSLPGAFPNDVIFAPSEGISTVGSSHIGTRIKAKRDPQNTSKFLKDEQGKIIPELDASGQIVYEKVYGGIGEFGGTSGAAPRVSGVFVLLGKLFPDLSMPEIRKCVLETGDAFWLEADNRFTWLQNLAKESGYNLKNDAPKDEKQKEIWEYLSRLYGRGRINAMAAYDMCAQVQEAKRQKGVRRSALDLAKANPVLKEKDFDKKEEIH